MKTNKITTGILVIVLIAGMSLSVNAQRGQKMKRGAGQGQELIHNSPTAANSAFLQLNDEQKAEAAKLRIVLTEKNLPIRNQLGEMRAKMKSLSTGDNQDLEAISNLIDEMSIAQAQIRKNAAEHRLVFRVLLTDDQQVMFDARQGKQRSRSNGMRGKGARMKAGNRQGCSHVNQ